MAGANQRYFKTPILEPDFDTHEIDTAHRPSRRRGAVIRNCVSCGIKIQVPASSKRITCSKECSALRKRGKHVGVSNKWSDAGRDRARINASLTGNLSLGTLAAQLSPIAGPFETNQEAKKWWVVSPNGGIHEVTNLKKWCRDHSYLFEGRSWLNAYAGLRQVQRWLMNRTKTRAASWYGWTLNRPNTTLCPKSED